MPIYRDSFKPGMLVSFPSNKGKGHHIPKFVAVITEVIESGFNVIDLVFKRSVYVPFSHFSGTDSRLNVSFETVFSARAALGEEKVRLEELDTGKDDAGNDFLHSRLLLTVKLYDLFTKFQQASVRTPYHMREEDLQELQSVFVSAYRPW